MRIVILALAVLALAPATAAAKTCAEPGETWERATPEEAGMDAVKLQEALDYGTQNAAYAVRVYRHGCLVGEDRFASHNRDERYESWSMAKSVTSMMFGRAMTLGLIQPDDPVGALVPEADGPHGAITMRDLLTMTSGLRWNGFRDYNIFTMPDRVRDALTLEIAHPAGTYYEYAQSPVSLLAEAVGRSAGEDAGNWVKKELTEPLGIPSDSWFWVRDSKNHIGGFYGVNMRPDDFGRLGDLLRRGGVWRGRRLLSRRYMREAVAPTPTNGCYGWLIWVNAAAPCIDARISERPIKDSRQFPDLPADLYRFSGLFGQLVTVFPSQDLVVVRTGQDSGPANLSGGQGWEHGLYARVLGALTDTKVVPPGEPPHGSVDESNSDAGFQNALLEPDQYSQGAVQPELPPAGPARARALWLRLHVPRPSRRGVVTFIATCPARSAATCRGRAELPGAVRARPVSIEPGATRLLRLRLRRKAIKALPATLPAVATTEAAGGPTVARVPVRLNPPRKRGARAR